MSRHTLPHCLSYSERCSRCCGACKGKPKKPVGGFSLPLVLKEAAASEDLVPAAHKAS